MDYQIFFMVNILFILKGVIILNYYLVCIKPFDNIAPKVKCCWINGIFLIPLWRFNNSSLFSSWRFNICIGIFLPIWRSSCKNLGLPKLACINTKHWQINSSLSEHCLLRDTLWFSFFRPFRNNLPLLWMLQPKQNNNFDSIVNSYYLNYH